MGTAPAPTRRTRIGVLAVGEPASGGSYQYELSVLQTLINDAASLSHRYSFSLFYGRGDHLPLEELRRCGWSLHVRRQSRLLETLRPAEGKQPGGEPERAEGLSGAASQGRGRLERFLLRMFFRRHGIDLLLCLFPTAIGFEVGIPYIMPIHDLQHRLHPEFPEVSANGEWARREYLFRHGAINARLVIVDSEIGKEDVVNCYGGDGVAADAVAVLPFVPAPYLGEVPVPEARRIRERTGLPERYFFYPAQLWPHKNHVRIVEAIGLLKREHDLEIHIGFTGRSDAGIRRETEAQIIDAADRYHCLSQIHQLGYLGAEEMSALYRMAQGLVMPTFFGPTNIPILEAWSLRCPVLTSDIRGVREQVGDAAVLVDPADPQAIANGIRLLATDGALRDDLRRRGVRRLALYSPADFAQRLTAILDRACRPGVMPRSPVRR